MTKSEENDDQYYFTCNEVLPVIKLESRSPARLRRKKKQPKETANHQREISIMNRRPKCEPQRNTPLPSLPKIIQLPNGKEVTFNYSSTENGAPVSGPKLRKKVKAKNIADLDSQYLTEIQKGLEAFLVLSFQDGKFKIIRQQAQQIFRYCLEWLYRRSSQTPRTDYSKLDLSDMIVKLTPLESAFMHTWLNPLSEWVDKFAHNTHFQEPFASQDIPAFRGFILQFLHALKTRFKGLKQYLDERYPLQSPSPPNSPLPDEKAEVTKLSETDIEQSAAPQPSCPICKKPAHKNRQGVLWCRSCQYHLHHVELGNIIDSYQHEPYLLKIEDFRKHGLILGVPGQGKSNTGLQLAYQLRNHAVPIWVFECEGEQWRNLIHMRFQNPNAAGEVLHFTPKNRFINPLAINPLQPPKGVHIEHLLEHFAKDFAFAYEMEPWAAAKLREALIALYHKKGWDITMNVCFKNDSEYQYPLPIELITSIEEVLANEYSDKVSSDLKGYLRTRVRDFNRLSMGYMWNTRWSIPWDELFTKNVIFELQEMDGQTKQFFACIMLSMVFEYMRVLGETDELRIVIFIEEASDLLSKDLKGEGGVNLGGQTVEIIEKLVSQSRKYGVGLVIMDQTPERLPFRVRNLPQTGIIHNLTSKESIQMVYDIFNQIQFIDKRRIGEAKVVSPHLFSSRNVRIRRFPARKVSDDEIQSHMTPYYQMYPWLKTPEPDITKKIRALIISSDQDTDLKEYSQFLMHLTPDDVDSSTGLSPPKVDRSCAKWEADIFPCVQTIRQILHRSTPLSPEFRRHIRAEFEQPSTQTQLRAFQSQLLFKIRAGSIEGVEVLMQALFDYVLKLIHVFSTSTNYFSAIRYVFRILVFKYLSLDNNTRIRMFAKFLDLLTQSVNRGKGGETA